MSKITESMKNWGANHPKTVRISKAFGTAILKGLLNSATDQLSIKSLPVQGDTEVLGGIKMAFYRQKADHEVVIEAVQWKKSNMEAIAKFLGEEYRWQVINDSLCINTEEGTIKMNDGWYIRKTCIGLVSISPVLFDELYELLQEEKTEDSIYYEPRQEEKTEDKVNHPNHYTFGSIEVIDYIRDKMTPDEFQGYCMGNILKYISRHKHKNGVEDLKKAQVYLGWLIESEEGAK